MDESIAMADKKKARVVFDYVAQTDGELSLKVGDVIENVTEVHPGWWTGVLRGEKGFFPVNYVEVRAEKTTNKNKGQIKEGKSNLPFLPFSLTSFLSFLVSYVLPEAVCSAHDSAGFV